MRTSTKITTALAALALSATGIVAGAATATAATNQWGVEEVTPNAPAYTAPTCTTEGTLVPTAQEGVIWHTGHQGWHDTETREETIVTAIPKAGYTFPADAQTAWVRMTSRAYSSCPNYQPSYEAGVGLPTVMRLVKLAPVTKTTTQNTPLVYDTGIDHERGFWISLEGPTSTSQGTWTTEGSTVTFTPAKDWTGTTTPMPMKIHSPSPYPWADSTTYTHQNDHTLTVTVTKATAGDSSNTGGDTTGEDATNGDKTVTPTPPTITQPTDTEPGTYTLPDIPGIDWHVTTQTLNEFNNCKTTYTNINASPKEGYTIPEDATKFWSFEATPRSQQCHYRPDINDKAFTTTAGNPIDPTTIINNLPAGVTAKWSDTTPIDWNKPGTYFALVVLTDKDGRTFGINESVTINPATNTGNNDTTNTDGTGSTGNDTGNSANTGTVSNGDVTVQAPTTNTTNNGTKAAPAALAATGISLTAAILAISLTVCGALLLAARHTRKA